MVIKSGSLIIQDFLIASNNLLLIHNELWVSYCIDIVGRKLYRGGGALLKTFFEPANILRLHITFSKKWGGTCLPAPYSTAYVLSSGLIEQNDMTKNVQFELHYFQLIAKQIQHLQLWQIFILESLSFCTIWSDVFCFFSCKFY